ncbi:alkyl sulfatase dimerization domain-containing protein [Microbacterium sp. ABRD28]|uniref:alkyl/aryl-sulfatase n=1 Tax=Microbacterium sp. ABRD28 TaxID=2268461 RepID=UPI000F54CCC6|nr:alkyl sulfatase dimerization domain-containing protein [Microbacterium sp. ABRD28]AZC12315.1 MBL fold metallo-hydrolase [Microbacterium sp. ABRD28]
MIEPDATPADGQDAADADRGFLAALVPGEVRGAAGAVVWDADAYAFLDGEAPATVHPSLWRQSQLVARQGLFELVDGIFQVRGLDLSNITFVEGERGVIVIDPLISTETAAAALGLYRSVRGDRPVAAVIYTHSHVDHFGGVKGVTTQAAVDAGEVPVLAPDGFLEHAISENLSAGTAMTRRAAYMYGAVLEKGPRGSVGAGLGQTTSTGTVTLIPPTDLLSRTGEERTIDGVRMVFQLAPGSEAPAEMHIFFSDARALCIAENATHTLHNVLTIRGALVRDARAWAGYLTEAIALFGDDLEVVFASHHWPTWGRERALQYLGEQRDLYAYLHDQTLRLLNRGLTGIEIAEQFRLPPVLERAWHARGYYGSVSHNVKAIYQRYMGWYDGNPARLWRHPPGAEAERYVDAMGGVDAVVDRARSAAAEGDLRWAAQLLDHAVFADPGHPDARALLAEVLEQLGFGSENGTWRNAYLMGADELRVGSRGTPVSLSADVLTALAPRQFLDALAVQVDGPSAWEMDLAIGWVFPDHGEVYRATLRNGVFTAVRDGRGECAVTVSVPRAALAPLAAGDVAGARRAGLGVTGDVALLVQLLGVLERGDPDFSIVVP